MWMINKAKNRSDLVLSKVVLFCHSFIAIFAVQINSIVYSGLVKLTDMGSRIIRTFTDTSEFLSSLKTIPGELLFQLTVFLS